MDADGPQGSFEFLRQQHGGRNEEECIESLGSMLIKMQIHASEDIYQKTKVKMANAELDAKKHSTKVIKETGPNVGRKIKIKKTIIGLQNNSNNTLSGNIQDNGIYKDLNSLTENNEDLSPKNSINNDNNLSSSLANSNCNNNSLTTVISNTSSLTTSQASTSIPTNPDLIRRPIRDRLIHLLAIRPFKKPELLVKLNRDGGLLRDKDKKGLGALLNQITNLKDNAYHLTRGAWHEGKFRLFKFDNFFLIILIFVLS